MKVRMTQQVQGSRDGRDWPAPGEEVDLPDDEARSLISGGAAVDASRQADTVLVPPKGVHTPGRTAMGGTSPLVEAPADAVSDPAAASRAAQAAASGEYAAEGAAGIAHQKSSGLAHTAESLRDAERASEETARAFQAAATPRVGQEGAGQPSSQQPAAQPSQASQPQAQRARLEAMTLEDLRAEAKSRNVATSGSKQELVDRLSQ